MRRFSTKAWPRVLAALAMIAMCTGMAFADGAKGKKKFAADKGASNVDVAAYPAKVQAGYKIFASRCSKCHTLARPINTDMTKNGWKMYVKRMMNKPDSGISPNKGRQIYRFLKYYQKVKDSRRKASKVKASKVKASKVKDCKVKDCKVKDSKVKDSKVKK